MFLFGDKEKVIIKSSCKLCLKDIEFEVSLEEYEQAERFPLKKESIHGDPEHKLTVYLNKNLDVENFEVEQLEEGGTTYTIDLTRQVLGDLGLDDDQIELYFNSTARDVVSVGELSLLSGSKSKAECTVIAETFVEKGLFKRVPGITVYYKAIPPYAALVSQLKKFNRYLTQIQGTVPPRLNKSFSQLEAQADSVKSLKELSDFLTNLQDDILEKITSQQQKIDSSIEELEKVANIKEDIVKLEGNISQIIEGQVEGLSKQFEIINSKMGDNIKMQMESLTEEYSKINSSISRSMKGQVDDLTVQLETINSKIEQIIQQQAQTLNDQLKVVKSRISENLKTLRLGIIQKTVEKVVEKTFSKWLVDITEDMSNQMNEIRSVSNDGMMRTKISLNRTAGIVDKATQDGLVKTKIALNRQVSIISKVSERGVAQIQDKFNQMVLPQIKTSIDKTIKEIEDVTTGASKSGESIRLVFDDISGNLNEIVTTTGDKITSLTDNIAKSFEELKDVFSTQVLRLFEDVLSQILERVEMSEVTTNEFWEQAKQITSITMKDIWFIRSTEAAKAHINDEIPKSKARVLIVAPDITDISLEAVKSIPARVNVRICCNFDSSDTIAKNILENLKENPNINLRRSERRDIWGVNRDYEEVIVCILSEGTTEIAGIGSIMEEHIKIFVPLLEDVWLGAERIL